MKTFNNIKESFEAIAPALYTMKGGNKYIVNYTKTIKESKDLKTLHKICEAIRVSDKDGDAKEYVSDVFSLCGTISESYKNDVEKLENVLNEAVSFANGKVDEFLCEEKGVNSSIEYLASHKKSIKNLVEYNHHSKIVENYVRDNGMVYVPIKESESLDAKIQTVNEKYKFLTEDEKKIVSMIEKGQIEEAFNSSKALCEEAIVNKGKTATIEEIKILDKTLEGVRKKVFEANKAESDINNFFNLINCINE